MHGSIAIYNPDGPRELILFVDDDVVSLMATRVLTGEGYRVITVRDGSQALDIFRKLHSKINLVILDFVMPVMDGSAVYRELRNIDPAANVVLISGFTALESLKRLLTEEACALIPKPLGQKKLLQSVRSALDAAQDKRQESMDQAVASSGIACPVAQAAP